MIKVIKSHLSKKSILRTWGFVSVITSFYLLLTGAPFLLMVPPLPASSTWEH